MPAATGNAATPPILASDRSWGPRPSQPATFDLLAGKRAIAYLILR